SVMWPTKGVEAAQRHLLNCLNAERPEKLSPEEALHIMRLARERGCHAGMQHVAHELSYSMPAPVDPPDEIAELQRQYIEAAKAMVKVAERIEKLAGPSLRAVA